MTVVETQKFWDAIKKVFPSNSKSQTTDTLNKNDTEKTANVFSNYFASAVKTIKSKITTMTNLVWRPNPIRHKTRKVFKFSYVSKVFVEKQLKVLQRGKSTGLDELPPGMIKDCAKEVSQPVAFVANLSIDTGRVPSLWKKAKVIPIHKGGNSKP
ncbi:MAG: hypothetical protein AAFY76_12035, partial [Cyanobacteria bacterium J06649_11]